VDQPVTPPVVAPQNQPARNSLIAGAIGWGLWLLLLCFNWTLGLVLSALTAGILGICLAILGYLPVIPWIIAVINGHRGLSQAGQMGGEGRGQAIAGLVMGYLGLVLTVCTLLFILLGILGIAVAPSLQNVLPNYVPTPPTF
jgi:hypothetical protein